MMVVIFQKHSHFYAPAFSLYARSSASLGRIDKSYAQKTSVGHTQHAFCNFAVRGLGTTVLKNSCSICYQWGTAHVRFLPLKILMNFAPVKFVASSLLAPKSPNQLQWLLFRASQKEDASGYDEQEPVQTNPLAMSQNLANSSRGSSLLLSWRERNSHNLSSSLHSRAGDLNKSMPRRRTYTTCESHVVALWRDNNASLKGLKVNVDSWICMSTNGRRRTAFICKCKRVLIIYQTEKTAPTGWWKETNDF